MTPEQIVRKIAECDPCVPSEVDGSRSCYFCGAFEPYPCTHPVDKHADDCVWRIAKTIAGDPLQP